MEALKWYILSSSNRRGDNFLKNLDYDDLLTGSDPNRVFILPIGGCGQFGMNTTLYIYQNQVYVVDCGVQFGDADRPGVDAIINDLAPFLNKFGKVTAWIFTHGHEDHIGAIPYVFDRWPAPVYCSPWTWELIQGKFLKKGREQPSEHTILEADHKYEIGPLSFYFVPVNHSIPMAGALALKFGKLRIFHSGDYKLDATPIGEKSCGAGPLEALAKSQPFDLFLSDSTNAPLPGFCPSESSTVSHLDTIIAAAPAAVIATTFSSNVWRIKTLIELAIKHGRKVIPFGSGIIANIKLASKFGYLDETQHVMLSDDEFPRLPRDKVMVIATGTQAEFGSGMHRLAQNEHHSIRIAPGDVVISSSRVIPGNEKYIGAMQDRLVQLGAKVFTGRSRPGIHVSGHGYQGDIQTYLTALKPRYFVPIHGTWTHLDACAGIGTALTHRPPEVINIENGDMLALSPGRLEKMGTFELTTLYIDGYSSAIAPVSEFRERFKIGELGCAILWGCVDMNIGEWVVRPSIRLVGLPLPAHIDQSKWVNQTMDKLADSIYDAAHRMDQDSLNEFSRLALRRMLMDVIRKKVVVISQIECV